MQVQVQELDTRVAQIQMKMQADALARLETEAQRQMRTHNNVLEEARLAAAPASNEVQRHQDKLARAKLAARLFLQAGFMKQCNSNSSSSSSRCCKWPHDVHVMHQILYLFEYIVSKLTVIYTAFTANHVTCHPACTVLCYSMLAHATCHAFSSSVAGSAICFIIPHLVQF